MEDCLQHIMATRPGSVLDAGVGFGLWGHLFRQYLDVWSGRILKTQWVTRIDGIEIDSARIQPHSRYLYDNIYNGDIRDLVPHCVSEHRYDLIFYGDVLEHLPKEDAMNLLRLSLIMTHGQVILRLPLGSGWRKEGRTPPDHHRSEWNTEDFDAYSCHIRTYDFYGNSYALLIFEGNASRDRAKVDMFDSIAHRLEGIENRLTKMTQRHGSAND
jgi:hypothetical protein